MTLNDHTAPLTFLGLGIPVIDAIAPNALDWAQGGALIAELSALPGTPDVMSLRRDTPPKIAAAQIAQLEFAAFCATHHYKPGDKKTLTADDATYVAGLFETMLTAAKAINRAARLLNQPDRELHVRYVGGTMSNKFHAIQSALGPRVTTHLLGAIGEEDASGNRSRLLERIALSGIAFEPFDGVALGPMAVSYVYSALQDRIVLRSPIDRLAEQFAGQAEQLATRFAALSPDVIFLEGSDIGGRKFGRVLFEAYAQLALKSGKPLVFAPPTDTDVLGDPAILTLMETIIDHPATLFMAMNEAEAVAMFCRQKLQAAPDARLQDDPQVNKALASIAAHLKWKRTQMPEGSVEPLALVSVGAEGAFHVTASGYGFVPGLRSGSIMSAVGAGDAFTGGSFAAYLLARADLLQQKKQEFSTETFRAITNAGQRLGRATAGIKGAQLPATVIQQLAAATA